MKRLNAYSWVIPVVFVSSMLMCMPGCTAIRPLVPIPTPINTLYRALSGQLISDLQTPIPTASVRLYKRQFSNSIVNYFSMSPYRTVTSNANGRFRILRVDPGEYVFGLVEQNGQQHLLDYVTIPQGSDVDLGTVQVKKGGTLNGQINYTYSDFYKSFPAIVYLPGTHWYSILSDNNSFSISAITPGTYSVVIQKLGYHSVTLNAITLENNQTLQLPSINLVINTAFYAQTGPTGNPGPKGIAGPLGPDGEEGPIGNRGATGNMGLIGPTGPKGPTGPQGPIGVPGPAGNKGPTGPAGPTGPTGPTGITGNKGPSRALTPLIPDITLVTLNITAARILQLTVTTTNLGTITGYYLTWSSELTPAYGELTGNSVFLTEPTTTLVAPLSGTYYFRVAAAGPNGTPGKWSNALPLTIGTCTTRRALPYNNPPQCGGIAIDHYGNIWIVDTYNKQINKYNSNFDLISPGIVYTNFAYPIGIAIDSTGSTYVVDRENKQVIKNDQSGNFVVWGTSGDINSNLIAPSDIAIDKQDFIYVADKGNAEVAAIRKYKPDGTFVAKWGTFGTGNSQFQYPRGICVDQHGNIIVADTSNHRLQLFNSSGQFLKIIGEYGDGNGQFNEPIGVTTDTENNIYVVDSLNHRLQKFNPYGEFIWSHSIAGTELTTPGYIAILPDGRFIIGDKNGTGYITYKE